PKNFSPKEYAVRGISSVEDR
ncbi:unnamed protein product, partial [Rotaria sp. Silwood1]